jgi:hypothetical protein
MNFIVSPLPQRSRRDEILKGNRFRDWHTAIHRGDIRSDGAFLHPIAADASIRMGDEHSDGELSAYEHEGILYTLMAAGRARPFRGIAEKPRNCGKLNMSKNPSQSRLVRVEGLEPPRVAPPEPKSGARLQYNKRLGQYFFRNAYSYPQNKRLILKKSQIDCGKVFAPLPGAGEVV